jgi:hypothetical protein
VQLLASISHSTQVKPHGKQESTDKNVPGKQEVQVEASEGAHALQDPLHLLQLDDTLSKTNPSAHSSHELTVKQLEHPTEHI